MDDMMQAQNYSTMGVSHHNPSISPAAIKYRLDNNDVLRDIELYLRSAKIEGTEDKDGKYTERMLSVGRPLANEEGIQGIMGYLKIMLSPHNVQGNMTWDRYDHLIFEIHTDLATVIMAERKNWGISIEDYDFIVNSIMHTLQLFISRTVDNKERESYGESIRSDERTVMKPNERKSWFGGLFQ
jgi:hypothetical protein